MVGSNLTSIGIYVTDPSQEHLSSLTKDELSKAKVNRIEYLTDKEKIISLNFEHLSGKKFNSLDGIFPTDKKCELPNLKICIIRIRSNGNFVTGLQIYGMGL